MLSIIRFCYRCGDAVNWMIDHISFVFLIMVASIGGSIYISFTVGNDDIRKACFVMLLCTLVIISKVAFSIYNNLQNAKVLQNELYDVKEYLNAIYRIRTDKQD